MNDGIDNLVYICNQFDQLKEVSKNNETQTTYEYDLRGNQTKESSKYFDLTVGGVTTTYYNTTDYSYNLRNQMTGTQINTPGADAQTGEVTYETLTASNVYNAQGQRVQKTEGEETTKYFYSGTALFYTTNGWGTLTTENILDLGGQITASKRFQDPNEPEANPFANKYYFYNYDIRGSVTNIVGPDGKLVTGYGYDEFDNQNRSGDGSFLNEVTFTGSVSDASTGLQYMNARFYQPTTGRFLSQDSYTGNAYDPWTQHLYSYCGNNPTNFIDPTGHSALSIQKTINKLGKDMKQLQDKYNGYKSKLTQYSKYMPSEVIEIYTKLCADLSKNMANISSELARQYKELASAKTRGKKEDDEKPIREAIDALVPILEVQGYDYYANQLSGNVSLKKDKWGEWKFENKTFYHKITVLRNDNMYPHGGKLSIGQDLGMKGTYFIPSGGVGEFLLVLELMCTVIDPNYNPGIVLKPGDVHIYMPVHGETSSYIPYQAHGSHGTDYYFRGSDLLYYKDHTTNEIVRP